MAPRQFTAYKSAMRQVGTIEAQNQLSALLKLVEQGEDILITRHGKPVARLVPPERGQIQQNPQQAADRTRTRAAAAKLGPFNWPEWKALRDEGRR